jgi:hypothetical protein
LDSAAEPRIVEVVATDLDLAICGCSAGIIPSDAALDAAAEPCDLCGEPIRRYAINVKQGYPIPPVTMLSLRPLDDRTVMRPPGRCS